MINKSLYIENIICIKIEIIFVSYTDVGKHGNRFIYFISDKVMTASQ